MFDLLFNNLTKLHDSEFDTNVLSSLIDKLHPIHLDYISLLEKCNGGYFFNGAFHVFGNCPNLIFSDISNINKFLYEEFNEFVTNPTLAFAEDIFGNLFLIDESGVTLFFIESGEKEFITSNFITAIDKICEESDYYVGSNLILDGDLMANLCNGYRYCPKIPFVLGGDYDSDNYILKSTMENLSFSASIANQIKNTPDGTKVTFKIT